MAQNVDPTIASTNASSEKKSTVEKSNCRDGHSVSKRLFNELTELMKSKPPGISAFPIDPCDMFNWKGTVQGATGTVYEGLEYKLSLHFPSKYPYVAPKIKFMSPIFHPNVDNAGNICLDILKEEWSAAYDVRTVLLSLQSLLGEPNNDSPLNLTAAKLWDSKEAYKNKVHEDYKANVEGKFGL